VTGIRYGGRCEDHEDRDDVESERDMGNWVILCSLSATDVLVQINSKIDAHSEEITASKNQ